MSEVKPGTMTHSSTSTASAFEDGLSIQLNLKEESECSQPDARANFRSTPSRMVHHRYRSRRYSSAADLSLLALVYFKNGRHSTGSILTRSSRHSLAWSWVYPNLQAAMSSFESFWANSWLADRSRHAVHAHRSVQRVLPTTEEIRIWHYL